MTPDIVHESSPPTRAGRALHSSPDEDTRPLADAGMRGVLEKLRALQVNLAEQAFQLDCQGRREAADVAMTTSAQLEELCEVLVAERPRAEEYISGQNHS